MLTTKTRCRPRESGDPVNTERAVMHCDRNKCPRVLGPRFRGDDRKERRGDDRKGLRVAAIALAVIACILPTRAPAAEEVRVGVSIPAAIAFVPLQVGIDRGIFGKHGLNIKRADLGGAARAHQALAATSLDIVVAGGPDLSLVAKGQHARAVGVITVAPRQTTLIVRNDNPMKVPAELKGKRVGISTTGGLSEWVVRHLSRQLGFGPAGITAVALGRNEAQVAALRAGQIDATVMDFASGLRLEELGSGRIFLKVYDYVPKMITQAVYAGNDTITKRPQAVRAFLSGWYEAVAFMRANKAATIPIAARQMDVSAVVAGKVYDELLDNYSRDGRFDPEGLRVLVDSLVEMGALRSADVSSAVYGRLLAALMRLGDSASYGSATPRGRP
jgi:sulfonate transport system substrate-binding protein